MKIEIIVPTDPTECNLVLLNGEYLKKPGARFFPLLWDDDDIADLLTEKQFDDFQSGITTFYVTRRKLEFLNRSFI